MIPCVKEIFTNLLMKHLEEEKQRETRKIVLIAESKDTSRNEVEIDLDKYMSLIDKLDEQEDKIKEMQEEPKRHEINLHPQRERC